MTVGQAVVWASQNIDPKKTPSELITSEPYVMGSHATCSGAWASGPEDCAADGHQWGYNRMTTVEGLFGAGDTIGGSAHKCSSGSFTEGRTAGKSAVKYVRDLHGRAPQVDDAQIRRLQERVFKPLEHYQVGRNEIVAGDRVTQLPVAAAGASAAGETPGRIRRRHQHLLCDQRADAQARPRAVGDADRGSRTHRRRGSAPAPARVGTPLPGPGGGGGGPTHAVRQETRWPGYYYRADHPKLDDTGWHVFTASRYDAKTGEWEMSKLPVHPIVD